MQGITESQNNADQEIEYPYPHPRGKEISQKKSDIDKLMSSIKLNHKEARECFKSGDLKMMGEKLNQFYIETEIVANLLEELEELITSPLL